MWAAIFLGMSIGSLAGMVYLANRFAKLIRATDITDNKKILKISGVGISIIMAALIYVTMGLWNVAAIYLHLVIFWVICDCVAFIIKKIIKKEDRHYIAGIIALLITIIYFSFGWYYAHHVYVTQYDVDTRKDIGGLKIVAFADSHVGATFHWQEFEKYVESMNLQKPDIVVIAGDFVDDDTKKEDMEKCCEALSNLKTKYGVYYIFGNHDKGYYDSKRGYNEQDLVNNLKKAGVVVLEDEIAPITDNVVIIGRQDKGEPDRKSMSELTKGLEDKYVIVLDHQPSDYDNEAEQKVDMVISGHTHGGQFIPILYAGEWMGVNDKTYGYEKRDVTDFIVTSGISNWTFKFKTGCISEYLVINVL